MITGRHPRVQHIAGQPAQPHKPSKVETANNKE